MTIPNPNCILTFSGLQVDPFALQPGDLRIDDIAAALSKIPRFLGHTSKAITVAEHCVRVSSLIAWRSHDVMHQMWGLLHDAAEAYLGDIPTPLKIRPEYAPIRQAEARILQAVAVRWALPWPIPHVVWVADREAFEAEAKVRQVVESAGVWTGWIADHARDRFLDVFRRLMDERGRTPPAISGAVAA